MHDLRTRRRGQERTDLSKLRDQGRTSRDELAFMLRQAPPPAFPADLIVPPRRGAVIAPAALAEEDAADAPLSAPAAPAPAPCRKPALINGRKPSKAERRAARQAAARERMEAARRDAAMAAAAAPERHESAEVSEPGRVPVLPEAPGDADVMAASKAPAPPAVAAEIEDSPAPASAGPFGLADHPAPLPPSRALAVRRQGLVDVIAHALRDSGVRLARWSARRRREQDTRLQLARAQARLRALEAQLEAIEALRERVRQAG